MPSRTTWLGWHFAAGFQAVISASGNDGRGVNGEPAPQCATAACNAMRVALFAASRSSVTLP